MGLATYFCVRFSALDAVHLGFDTVVVEDGCRGVESGRDVVVAPSRDRVDLVHAPEEVVVDERGVANTGPNVETWKSLNRKTPNVEVCWAIDAARWKETLNTTLR